MDEPSSDTGASAPITKAYSVLHETFDRVASAEGIAPFECRVLLAIHECGGSARTDQLEALLRGRNGGSQVRRSLLRLYDTGHATGAATDGGVRRRGIRSRATLTDRGRKAVQAIAERGAIAAEAAA
jgi:hypothetical protein